MRKVLIVFALLLLPSALWAQGALQVTYFNGPVQWRAASSRTYVPLTRPTPVIQAGDELRTGDNASVMLTAPDGSYMVVSENSKLVIEDSWSGSARSIMNLMLGQVRFYIQRLGGRPNPYSVRTPTALIAVRGTIFDVNVDPAQIVVVECFEGQVKVENPLFANREVILDPDMKTLVRPNERPMPPVRLSAELNKDREIKINGLPFTIIGTFRERVETFGQSEIAEDTILIPYSVARYFTGNDRVKQIFFSVADSADVPLATEQIHDVLQSRHRAQSVYRVDNLTQLLAVAAKSANALTTVLLLISILTLIVSGVGIMNIMLATVSSRIREIGIRKAVGATNSEIRAQFLAEAMLISLSGGVVGIFIGLALPYSVRFITDYRVPVSGWSIIIAVLVSSLVGVLFGTAPAARAAQMDPVESLRYE